MWRAETIPIWAVKMAYSGYFRCTGFAKLHCTRSLTTLNTLVRTTPSVKLACVLWWIIPQHQQHTTLNDNKRIISDRLPEFCSLGATCKENDRLKTDVFFRFAKCAALHQSTAHLQHTGSIFWKNLVQSVKKTPPLLKNKRVFLRGILAEMGLLPKFSTQKMLSKPKRCCWVLSNKKYSTL